MKNSNNEPKRSDEPIWWALFSAGGVCFAVFLPGLMLVLGILWPLGLITAPRLNYQSLQQFISFGYGLPALAVVGACICLPLFHAAHRIHHGLHDLKLAKGLISKILCYGLAALCSAAALGLVLRIIIAEAI